MPIYEYRRPDGSKFELVQSFSDDALTHDPDTGVKVQRVLHAPALHFKGSGFYNTDYGTRKRQRETAAAAGDSPTTESSANGDSGSSAGGDSGSSANGKGPAAEDKRSSANGKSASSESKSKAEKSSGSKSESVPGKS